MVIILVVDKNVIRNHYLKEVFITNTSVIQKLYIRVFIFLSACYMTHIATEYVCRSDPAVRHLISISALIRSVAVQCISACAAACIFVSLKKTLCS